MASDVRIQVICCILAFSYISTTFSIKNRKYPVALKLKDTFNQTISNDMLGLSDNLPTVLIIDITSEVFNGSFELAKEDGFFHSSIPVYLFHETQKELVQMTTGHVVYYSGHTHDCQVSFKITLKRTPLFHVSIHCGVTTYTVDEKHGKYLVHVFTYSPEDVGTFDHVEIPTDDENTTHSTYSPRMRKRRSVDMNRIRYVETFIVVDTAFFRHHEYSKEKTTDKVMDIMQGVDRFYRKINIRIVLAGVEIWTQKDKIPVSPVGSKTFAQFASYGGHYYSHADNRQFVTGIKFADGLLGSAAIGGMCRGSHSTGINSFDPEMPLLYFVTTMAHEMGHNFAMLHDKEGCTCGGPTKWCMMWYQNKIPPSSYWSDCSLNYMRHFFSTGRVSCIDNYPSKNLAAPSKCGNYLVEDGEECDCGEPGYCFSQCCDPNTCKFKKGVQCYSGGCCKNCTLLPQGMKCREKSDDCDIVDVCDGVSTTCRDVKKEDGVRCDSKRGVCFSGTCRSRDVQCKKVWGEPTTEAHHECYKVGNRQRNEIGNCGERPRGHYYQCYRDSTFCGLLQCVNMRDPNTPILPKRYPLRSNFRRSKGSISWRGQEITCRTTMYQVYKGFNPSYTPEMTPCGGYDGRGFDRFCSNFRCKPHKFTSKCDVTCAGEGKVCGNDGKCVDLVERERTWRAFERTGNTPKKTTAATTVTTTIAETTAATKAATTQRIATAAATTIPKTVEATTTLKASTVLKKVKPKIAIEEEQPKIAIEEVQPEIVPDSDGYFDFWGEDNDEEGQPGKTFWQQGAQEAHKAKKTSSIAMGLKVGLVAVLFVCFFIFAYLFKRCASIESSNSSRKSTK